MKNKTLIIVLSVAAALIVLFLFWDNIKNLFAKKESLPTSTGAGTTTTNTTTGMGGAGATSNTGITPPPSTNLVGKTVYAAYDGAKVFNKDFTVYKTAAAGEWMGPVTKDPAGTGTLDKYVELSSLRLAPKAAVKL